MSYIKLTAVILIFLCGLTSARFGHTEPRVVKLSIVSGNFTLSQAGVPVEGLEYAKDGTAKAGAIIRSFACDCEVRIHRPDIRVNAKLIQDTSTDTTATVTWNNPPKRENGDPLLLGEIQHYVLQYWLEGGAVISITVGKNNRFVVNNLTPGVWMFKLATVDTDSWQSIWTKTVTKTI